MRLENSFNYLAAFLTMRCCYNCSYCINWKSKYTEVSGQQWIDTLSRLETDLPVTLCGGEPSMHEDFYKIINGIPQKVDILTNLQFNVKEFIKEVRPERFDNTKQFAPIRVSFHQQFMDMAETLDKIEVLLDSGYRVGLYCVDCQKNKSAIRYFKKIKWLDFQVKPLLDNTVITGERKEIQCRTRELLVAPNLKIYRCHRNLYKQENPIEVIDYIYRLCINANECHPCDTKVKRDRFGKEGYCAVEIK